MSIIKPAKVYLGKLLPLLLLLCIIILSACSSSNEKAEKRIAETEENLKESENPATVEQLDELLNQYTSFVDNFPKDTMASQYLYRAINLSMGMGKGEQTMNLIDKSLNEYPNQPKIAEIVFLKAYVFENLLGDLGKAATIYQGFPARFPNHELADDAEAAVRNIGKSPDELIREFEAINSTDSLK